MDDNGRVSEYGATSEVRYSGPISLLSSAKPECPVSIQQNVCHGKIEAFAIYYCGTLVYVFK